MKAASRRGRPREFDTEKALRGAMELFWRRGYDASTLPELQAAMGNISPPSFYAAFGSKEKVFADAVDLYRKEVACEVASAIEGGDTARSAIAKWLRLSLKMFTSSTMPAGCLFLLGAVNSTNSAAEEMLRDRRRQGFDMVRKRIRRGIADGDVPKGADADAIASFYFTVVNGLAFNARDGMPVSALAKVVESALDTWDSLVRPARARRRATK